MKVTCNPGCWIVAIGLWLPAAGAQPTAPARPASAAPAAAKASVPAAKAAAPKPKASAAAPAPAKPGPAKSLKVKVLFLESAAAAARPVAGAVVRLHGSEQTFATNAAGVAEVFGVLEGKPQLTVIVVNASICNLPIKPGSGALTVVVPRRGEGACRVGP